jgi:hypothetical protein
MPYICAAPIRRRMCAAAARLPLIGQKTLRLSIGVPTCPDE